jgi:hypothetical protein
MEVEVDIEINKPKQLVWSAIIDIENAASMISGIVDLDILHQPDDGIVGLTWKETRLMFGREASEIMWITEAVENHYYCTRAESHGAVYITKLSLNESGGKTLLTMSFSSKAQTLMVKIVSTCMGVFLKRSMKKALRKDLADIKETVERS